MSENALTTCPACRQTGPLLPLGSREGYDYAGCKPCGSMLMTPWPTASLVEDTLAAIEPQITHVAQPDRQIELAAKIFSKHLPSPAAGKATRVIDVNAMHGYNVMALRKLGYEAVGLNAYEHMHVFAAKTYGDKIFHHQSASDYAATGEKTDIIVSINSFTLQLDPDSHATALKALLKPDGIIYIEENDGNHFNTPRHVDSWPLLEPPFTAAVYSRDGMAKLLARHGLAVRKSAFTWAPYMRLIVGHRK